MTYLSGCGGIECCVVELVRVRLDLLGEAHGGRLGLSEGSVGRKASVAPEYNGQHMVACRYMLDRVRTGRRGG